jgi:hypothetical protein
MERVHAEEFTQSLQQIGEGWYRQVALGFRLGIPEALGLGRREWADRFGHTLRSVEQRREAVAELSADGFSNRAIADALGVHHDTIDKDKLALVGGNPPGDEDAEGGNANGDGGNPPRGRGGIVTGVAMSPLAERGDDFYATPVEAVRALLKIESFNGPIWECACGDGAIVRPLRRAGHEVVATNLIDYGCPDSTSGVDFLMERRAPEGVETICTNPPFNSADEFVRHALELVPRVVMLLRFLFIESQGRCDIIDSGHLRRVYPFIDRLPRMHRNGWDGPRNESTPLQFAWFCWDRDYCGDIIVRRIWAKERDNAQCSKPAAGGHPRDEIMLRHASKNDS